MLREDRGGDVGVHADHHVLDAPVHAFPPAYTNTHSMPHGSLNSLAL